jgi:hypothetical protein
VVAEVEHLLSRQAVYQLAQVVALVVEVLNLQLVLEVLEHQDKDITVVLD